MVTNGWCQVAMSSTVQNEPCHEKIAFGSRPVNVKLISTFAFVAQIVNHSSS